MSHPTSMALTNIFFLIMKISENTEQQRRFGVTLVPLSS